MQTTVRIRRRYVVRKPLEGRHNTCSLRGARRKPVTAPRFQTAAQQIDPRGDGGLATLTVGPDGDDGVGRDLTGGHDRLDSSQHLLHRGTVWLPGAVVGNVALVEDVGV